MIRPWPADPDQLTFDSPELHGYDGPTVEWWFDVVEGTHDLRQSRIRSYLNSYGFHHHVCLSDGPEDEPHFYQHEGWPVREMVDDHVARLVERELRL